MSFPEASASFTGTPEAERLEAVKLALASGNDINARADFGDFPIEGDPAYTLIYYPTNIDDLADLGVGADLREIKKHPDYAPTREEILSMIWNMEEEIMGRTEGAA